jgi:hypothetical protein
MRAIVFLSVLMLAATIAVGPAAAQAKKDSKPAAAANETRYFTSISGIMDDQADTVLKETRSAGKVTGAVLDVCYPAKPNSDRKDRFVATLTVDGNRLSGSTESLVGKQPVTIALTRKATPAGVNFDGKVTIGGSVSTIASTENADISEKEYNSGQDADDEIMTAPADYTNVSPEAVGVRVKPDDVANFVNKLRGQSVEIALGSLLPSCAELRRDQQVVHLNIDPERAADFIARMKSEPGVVAAGWTSGRLDMDRTVRFDAGDWREAGKVNKDKLAATVSAVLAKALSATPLAANWNDDTGELRLTFKRPNADLPALGLTQTLLFKAMVASDKPGGGSDKLVLWLSFPNITTADDSTGARLKIAESSDASAEENVPADDGDSLTAVARALKAQRWDADNSSWK